LADLFPAAADAANGTRSAGMVQRARRVFRRPEAQSSKTGRV
jgi:hypothetical protein